MWVAEGPELGQGEIEESPRPDPRARIDGHYYSVPHRLIREQLVIAHSFRQRASRSISQADGTASVPPAAEPGAEFFLWRCLLDPNPARHDR